MTELVIENTHGARKIKPHSYIDWMLFGATVPILLAGLVTMNSFSGQSSYFSHQIVWIAVSLVIFFVVSFSDLRFLKRTGVLITFFSVIVLFLLALFSIGHIAKGAESWFRLGLFSIQPSDPAKIVLI
jgi:cell division protein FtsW (lipid II flippase)